METARQIVDENEGQGKTSPASLTSLISEHGPAMARVCMALLGDAEGAEQALEQVARDAGTKGGPPRGVSARGWIFGLARAACAARVSRLPLRTSTQLTGPQLPEAASPSAAARTTLAHLKPTEREAVVLHAVGGLDAADVAIACGVELAIARSRIGQGMTKLAELPASAEGGSR